MRVTQLHRSTYLGRRSKLGSAWAGDQLKKLMEFACIDHVVDAGANEGQFVKTLRGRMGFKGPVVSVEPDPRLVQVLRKKSTNDPEWTVVCAALGAQEGTALLHLTENSQFNSLLESDPTLHDTFNGGSTVLDTLEVPVTTLNKVLLDWASTASRSILLKLDTQGNELDVLKGCDLDRDEIVAVLSEVSFSPIYSQACTYAEVNDHMERHGFRLAAIIPNNGGHFPRLFDMDAIYLKDSIVDQV